MEDQEKPTRLIRSILKMGRKLGNYPKVQRRSKVTNRITIRVLKIRGEFRPCYVYNWHGKRRVQVVHDKRILERIAKIEMLRHLRPIDSYTYRTLRRLSNEELEALAQLNKVGYGKIRKSDPIKSRNELIDILTDLAEKKRVEKKLRRYNRTDLENITNYIGESPAVAEIRTKPALIEYLSYQMDEDQLRNWQINKEKAEMLPNDEKYIIRMLYDEKGPLGYQRISREKIIKLVGEKTFHRLEDKLLIQSFGSSYGDLYYLTWDGQHIYKANKQAFENLNIPKYKSMAKEIPHDVMLSAKALAKNKREYSIGIDFERELKNPQQIVAIQGAETFTYHLNEDFEFFGHTHPNVSEPHPSKNDLLNMKVGRPEFIVAGKTGKTIIVNIEDDNQYRKWKSEDHLDYSWFDFNKKEYRDRYFKFTGVRVYKYRKGMIVTLINDPKLEKAFPFFGREQLSKIAKGSYQD